MSNIEIKKENVRVALVVPHIFINNGIRENVIFSPGQLALDLCKNLGKYGVNVTLFSPGKVSTTVENITADMSLFEKELMGRGYGYMELLKKHPITFVTLARQVQAEVIDKAYKMASEGRFDVVHIYANEEDLAMQFANLCRQPVLFTHHDPFNFLVKYKSVFPKYKHLNWISTSFSQRATMPEGTNWAANIYHGVNLGKFMPRYAGESNYVVYVGRIIEQKGVHFAIEAVQKHNEMHPEDKLRLKIAGKHYADSSKDKYWQEKIEPELSEIVEYVGYLKGEDVNELVRGARGLLVPSLFEEPFGMVSVEALACGTPVIGLNHGATAEIIEDGTTGFIIKDGSEIIQDLAESISRLNEIDRKVCRETAEKKFSLERMVQEHADLYKNMCN